MSITLSNFYQDRAENVSDFDQFFKIYEDVGQACVNYVDQIGRDGFLGNISTYKTIPLQNVDATPMRYSLSEILSIKTVYDFLGIADYPLLGRQIMWAENTITVEQKVEVLTRLGYYLDLTALADYTVLWSQNAENDISKAINGKVVWLDVYDGIKKLHYRIDYALANQKLFLIGDYVTTNKDDRPVLQLKNIAVDFAWSERRFGSIFNIKYNNSITLNEYNSIIQNLALVTLGGPRIKNIRSAIQSIAGTSDVDIYDRYTRDISKHRFWDLTTQEGSDGEIIGPFDYIVEINNETGLDPYRIYMMTNYLQIISPTGSKFTLLLNLYYSDIYQAYLKASDGYHADIGHLGVQEDTQDTVYDLQELLNNPEKELNDDFEIYRGYVRTDQHDDVLIPV